MAPHRADDPSGAHPVPAEFSRRVRLGQVMGAGVRLTVAADAAERAALVARFDLASLDRLEAEIAVEPVGRSDLYRVSGRFSADLAQFCVVTTDPVPASPSETFQMLFTTDPAATEAGPIEVDIEAQDPPEPIFGDAIDVGEAVVQQFALALDPYPRAPWAEAEGEVDPAPEVAEPRPNPFAVLAKLRR